MESTTSVKHGRPVEEHRGAPGLAILAALPPASRERAEIPHTRELGYVRTTGEVIPGLSALAAPLRFADGSVASLAIVFVAGELDEASAVDRLKWHAHRLQALVSRS
jgi:DNA-binding IclR family transcriptional regulator